MQTDGSGSLDDERARAHARTQMSIVSKVAIKASTGTALGR